MREMLSIHADMIAAPPPSWKPILDDIESRCDAYLEQENRVNRRKMTDNRIHACLYFIAPTGHAYVCIYMFSLESPFD